MTKKDYRKIMKERRSALSDNDRKLYNDNIRKNFLGLRCVAESEWIYPFVSYSTEADTIEIIRYYLENGSEERKRIAVPKVKGREMDFYEIRSMNELSPGYMGIPEPIEKRLVIADRGVMIMPGLVFDHELNRIGYGGGYYDRYLSKYDNDNLIKAAIAYDFQVVDKIDSVSEEHDVRPDIIVTDKAEYTLLSHLKHNLFKK